MASEKTCIALRHLAFEDLGSFAGVIAAAGYGIAYRDVGVDAIDADAVANADLLVVLGGPIGVYDRLEYPYLAGEIEAIGQRLRAGGPTLGVCLGHQMMAAALGAAVAPGPGQEIGWAPVRLTGPGWASVLAPLGGNGAAVPVLHWHGDNAGLPAGAVCLAETDGCPNQAFAVGRHGLGLQFHLEVDPARIEQWLIGHTGQLFREKIDPRAVRVDTAAFGVGTAAVGGAILSRWLAGVSG